MLLLMQLFKLEKYSINVLYKNSSRKSNTSPKCSITIIIQISYFSIDSSVGTQDTSIKRNI